VTARSAATVTSKTAQLDDLLDAALHEFSAALEHLEHLGRPSRADPADAERH
jgi:ABC-type transporter Mla subunit MlaD